MFHTNRIHFLQAGKSILFPFTLVKIYSFNPLSRACFFYFFFHQCYHFRYTFCRRQIHKSQILTVSIEMKMTIRHSRYHHSPLQIHSFFCLYFANFFHISQKSNFTIPDSQRLKRLSFFSHSINFSIHK